MAAGSSRAMGSREGADPGLTWAWKKFIINIYLKIKLEFVGFLLCTWPSAC